MDKRIFVYDLETLNIFTASFIDKNSDEIRQFVISDTKDQRLELFKFLDEEVKGLVGFNNIFFDAQVLEYMYRNPDCTSNDIRNYAQIITSEDDRRVDVPEWKLRIPQLDLYKINHFDNKNRRTGLKWCEFMMDLDNIEDMPSQGEGNNWEQMVLSYNLNDVIATKELYKRTAPMIELRKKIKAKYNLNCLNYSNTKIGSELLLKIYCQRTRRNITDIRSMRTYRKSMSGSEIIFDYVKFKSEEFNLVLNYFKNIVITSTKKDKTEKEVTVKYKNFEYVYGKGGIHGSLSNSIIIADNEYMIIDADVSSLYPNIAIANRLYPRHLGEEFCDIYKKDIVDVRLAEKHKKELGDKAIVDGFKEAANATYGNSNQLHSWLYDPLYTMKTTINGQLIISMLCENLTEIPDLTIIQANTDGITVKIPRRYIDIYYNICNEWMKLTKWELEYAEYSKMIIFDVNNYLALYTNGKYKAKGRCEFENIPLHKNKSHNIVPIAFFNYFVKNIPINDTIRNHRNIFDFCAGVKARKSDKKGMAWFELHSLEGSELKIKKLSKTVRYYISNKGQQLIKRYEDGSQEFVEAPFKSSKVKKFWNVTYFNKRFNVVDFKDYDIDYNFYTVKTQEWIKEFDITNKLNI